MSGFKPLSGIHLARTFGQINAHGIPVMFQTPIGNSSRAHLMAPAMGARRSFVSNPYREFISRALADAVRGRGGRGGFKPLSGIHLARTLESATCPERTQRSFKPLSGIHLARTNTAYAAVAMIDAVSNPYREFISRARIASAIKHGLKKFQTPIGNSSRAHCPTVNAPFRSKMFQTPIGNSSRAHFCDTV